VGLQMLRHGRFMVESPPGVFDLRVELDEDRRVIGLPTLPLERRSTTAGRPCGCRAAADDAADKSPVFDVKAGKIVPAQFSALLLR
jgi:hypothetical protein